MNVTNADLEIISLKLHASLQHSKVPCKGVKLNMLLIKRSEYGEGVFPSNADEQQLVGSPDTVYAFCWSF